MINTNKSILDKIALIKKRNILSVLTKYEKTVINYVKIQTKNDAPIAKLYLVEFNEICEKYGI